jgi:DNA-dependent RNA polymerase auxiliary subunit epsilon
VECTPCSVHGEWSDIANHVKTKERKLVVERTSKNTINDYLQVNNHEVERQQHKEQAQLAYSNEQPQFLIDGLRYSCS